MRGYGEDQRTETSMTDTALWPDDEAVLQTQWDTDPHTLIIRGNEAGLRELRELLDRLLATTSAGTHYHLDRGISLLDGVCSLILQRGRLQPPGSGTAPAPEEAWQLPTDIPAVAIDLVNAGQPLRAMHAYRTASGLPLIRVKQIVRALSRVREAGVRLELMDAGGATTENPCPQSLTTSRPPWAISTPIRQPG